jgi:hypothetical protein
MLTLYRRHIEDCAHRSKGQNYTTCSCPIWCDGELDGKRFRRSVGLRDWARAAKRVDQWEAKPKTAVAPSSLAFSVNSYLGDCRARNLKASTVASYEKTLDHLQAFGRGRGITQIDQVDLALLTDFRASRKVQPSTSGKELETLRAFCAFAAKRGWISENFAKELSAPLESGPPGCHSKPRK